MSMSYVKEKCFLAVEQLVIARDIKSGLREAVDLLLVVQMHSSDLPDEFRNELAQIVSDSTKRSNQRSTMGSLAWTIQGMRIKTAQELASRILCLYLDIHDL